LGAPRHHERGSLQADARTQRKLAGWRGAQEAKLKPLQDRLTAVTNDAEKKKLSKQIEEMKDEKPPFEFALAVRERGPKPPPTQVLIRGNAGNRSRVSRHP
jgi:hypothetical protein